MNPLVFFAHAGEMHDTAMEEAAHTFFAAWYIVLPLYIILLFGIGAIVYLASRKSQTATSGVLLATLFVVGIAAYNASPVLSVFSLTVGFALAALTVLTGLKKPHHEQRKKGK